MHRTEKARDRTTTKQVPHPRPSAQGAAGTSSAEYLPDFVLARLPALYATERQHDLVVQVKYFLVETAWTWYAIEYSPEEEIFFGLVVGMETELGYFALADLTAVRSPRFRLPVERDLWFRPMPLSEVKAALRLEMEGS